MAGAGCEPARRVAWELRVLTVPQLGSLSEAAGIPNTMKRHLSQCRQKKGFLLLFCASTSQG